MGQAELSLRFIPDDDGLGQLVATVRSGAFCGRDSAWVNPDQVKETFIAALKVYPLSESDLPIIEGGFWTGEVPASLDQCHLRIAVRPYNTRGTLLVQIDLATEFWTTPDKDQQQSVTTRFLTEYAALPEFATSLEQVLDGDSETAVLSGLPN